jgi:hypothetical protein
MRGAVAICLAAGLACDSDRTPPNWTAAPAPAPAPALEPLRARAHQVLSSRCGTCHEGHRASAKPAALAIFDLDRDDWPSRFDEARFSTAFGRLRSAPESDRQAFIAWRDAELTRRDTPPR